MICKPTSSPAPQDKTLSVGRLADRSDKLHSTLGPTGPALTFTEFNILLELVQRREERGASYDQLAQATRQGVVENNTINTHIRHLRKKFRELEPDFDCIENVYGFGYRWSLLMSQARLGLRIRTKLLLISLVLFAHSLAGLSLSRGDAQLFTQRSGKGPGAYGAGRCNRPA